jgi:hypothetical protein
MARIGGKNKAIQIDLDITREALRNTLDFEDVRPKSISVRKPDRPITYSKTNERNLLRHVRLNPKDTYEQVRVVYRLFIKRDTIKKILKRYSNINWRAGRRPFLTEENAAKRLAWCLKWRHMIMEE